MAGCKAQQTEKMLEKTALRHRQISHINAARSKSAKLKEEMEQLVSSIDKLNKNGGPKTPEEARKIIGQKEKLDNHYAIFVSKFEKIIPQYEKIGRQKTAKEIIKLIHTPSNKLLVLFGHRVIREAKEIMDAEKRPQ
ncbi:MAG: hypothetical protein ABH854_02540 [Candidatus Diapherotrites archaeon]|nr:hypothetical protein [Candidatus Micrarchaeota archaeon]MBU1939960.1 hypothetical protein [Candidatus Micrarchaeota archaeon]